MLVGIRDFCCVCVPDIYCTVDARLHMCTGHRRVPRAAVSVARLLQRGVSERAPGASAPPRARSPGAHPQVDTHSHPEAIKDISTRLGMHSEFFGHVRGRYGNALLSKFPILSVAQHHLRCVLCAGVCVCVCVCMCVCVCLCLCVCVCVCYVCMYVCMHAMHVCMHVCMCVCMYVRTYTCIHAYMHTYMHACMYGLMDGCMDGWMDGYTHTHIHAEQFCVREVRIVCAACVTFSYAICHIFLCHMSYAICHIIVCHMSYAICHIIVTSSGAERSGRCLQAQRSSTAR